MIKTIDNSAEIYKFEKKVEKLQDKSLKRKRGADNDSFDFKIEMAKDELSRLKLFDTYNVVGIYDSYFPYKFNDHRQLVMISSNGNKNDIFSYKDIEKVSIQPHYVHESKTYTSTKKKGGITRSLVGGALFGGVGAVVGASTAKSNSSSITKQSMVFKGYNFFVYFKNGETSVFTNLAGSPHKPHNLLLELEYYFNSRVIGKVSNNNPQLEVTERTENNEEFNMSDFKDNKYQPNIQGGKMRIRKSKFRKSSLLFYIITLVFLTILAALLAALMV